jgi:peptide deformylase
MEILKFPHPALFKPCKEVTVFGTELKVLLDSMYETMKHNNGIGLAANQVGLPWRMFVMELESRVYYCINPKIIARGLETANQKEGCLSAPGEFIVVPDRNKWVKLEYQDEEGIKNWIVAYDISAVCIQHELEHLDGKSHLQSKSIPKQKRIELAKKWGFKVK